MTKFGSRRQAWIEWRRCSGTGLPCSGYVFNPSTKKQGGGGGPANVSFRHPHSWFKGATCGSRATVWLQDY
jgi:hypothetical protein